MYPVTPAAPAYRASYPAKVERARSSICGKKIHSLRELSLSRSTRLSGKCGITYSVYLPRRRAHGCFDRRRAADKRYTLKLMFRLGSIALIGVYQRYVSPHKGFCCAYRVHTGRASCSEFGRRAISRHGLTAGLMLLRQRFNVCALAAVTLAEQAKNLEEQNEPCPVWSKQGGIWCVQGCIFGLSLAVTSCQ
jgi:putative component of membrane protein insertase Oxa1/YidC/SpoIIIJ protein YidD